MEESYLTDELATRKTSPLSLFWVLLALRVLVFSLHLCSPRREAGAMEEEGERARSFRREGYINRRVFLRSYPLQWEDADVDGDEVEAGRRGRRGKAVSKAVESLKHRVVVAVLHLGEARVLLLRKLRSKVDFYLVACHPFGFKPPSSKLLVDD